MSFVTGTQVEQLYAMPASCTAVTAAAQTVLTGTPTATNPHYMLPAYFFQSGGGGAAGVGKHLRITAGGFFSTGTLVTVTDVIQLAFDPTPGTLGTAIAKTGAFAMTATTLAGITNGAWYLDCLITCQTVGKGATATLVNALGTLDMGGGNNATTTANAGYMIGSPNANIGIDQSVPYAIELWNTWSVTTGAPTITCTQLNIYGCN